MSYCELPDFYTERKTKARKQHRCVECRRAIQPGGFYMLCSGKWDGELGSHKQHISCYDFARKLNHYDEPYAECEVPFGGVSEAVAEMFDDCPTVPGVRAEWQAIVESHKPFECEK